MRQSSGVLRREWPAAGVPLPVRVLGKLVLEVLPATLASVIGAFLFAYSQFGHAALPAAPEVPAQAAPASAEMVQLVREEHTLVRDFLRAQQQEAARRAQAADAADARAMADATLAAVAGQREATLVAATRPVPHTPLSVVAAAAPIGPSMATAQLPPLVIAGVQADSSVPPAEPQPANPSLLRRTLAVPGRAVAMTLRAVMGLGGIPSWIGRRVGADRLDGDAAIASAAS